MSSSEHDFRKFFESAKKRTTYWKEKAVLDFTEEIVNRMQALAVSRSELADRISAKPAFVTKALRGDNNFTIETMVKLGRALNARVRVHLEPDGMDSEWLDFLKEKPNWLPQEPESAGLNKKSFQTIKTSKVTIHEPITAGT